MKILRLSLAFHSENSSSVDSKPGLPAFFGLSIMFYRQVLQENRERRNS